MKTSNNIDGPCVIMAGCRIAILKCTQLVIAWFYDPSLIPNRGGELYLFQRPNGELSPSVALTCVAIHDNRIYNYRSINPDLVQFDAHTLIRNLGQEQNALFANTTLRISTDGRRAHNLYMRDRLTDWILENDGGPFVPMDLDAYRTSGYFRVLQIPPVLGLPVIESHTPTPPPPEAGQNEVFDEMMAELDAILDGFHAALQQD